MIAPLLRLPASPAMAEALRACRRTFGFAFLFSALVNLLFIAPMLYMLQVYDRVVPTRGAATLVLLTFVLLFALMTLAGLDAIRSRLLVRAGVRLDQLLSKTIFEATLAKPEASARRLSRQAVREFDTLRQALTGPAILGLLDAPWIPVYLLVAFLIHPWVGVLTLLGSAMVVFLAWRNEKATRVPLQQANEVAGRAYASYDSTLGSSDVVRALGLRRALIGGHLDDRRSMLALQTQASMASSSLTATSKFLRMAVQSLALGLGALLAINAKISPGAIFASMFIVGRAMAPIDQLVGSWKTIVQARGAYKTLADLLDETPPAAELTRLPDPGGRLEIEGLTREDGNGRKILDGISFRVQPGEIVAIVGPSGAGKSTLVRCLAGALQPHAGTIRFDGADQANWDPELLSAHIGYMPQESSLFAGTIKENISRFRSRLGEDPAQIDAAAIQAARVAGAHDMILRLGDGYDYRLSLGGRGLSSGQAQRIALARALFRNPRYMILDEPNAHLDAEGDMHLAQILQQWKSEGITVLIVAHRMNILPLVDTLLVIQDGRVAAHGPRDEILRKMAPPPPQVPKREETDR
jgi:ATP-binding cassette subfamily C protein